jgi:deoxyribodipyrimidine photo-lyase
LSRVLVLFTRDLRVRDQPALAAAAREADGVLPLFVFDEALLAGPCGSPNRVSHLLDCLGDLDRALRERGSRLLIRRGDPVEEALRIAKRAGAGAIHISEDFSRHAKAREKRLEAACRDGGIRLCVFPGVTAVEPGAVLPSGGGDHYRVFTPYWRAWREQPRRQVEPAPRSLGDPPPAAIRVGRMPSLRALCGSSSPAPRIQEGGETAARRRLERWLRGPLAGYETGHDDLPAEATSRLSADLHLGCLSTAAVLARVEGKPGGEEFSRQLCWRDFHHQVLAAFPDLPRRDYRPRGRRRWRRDAADARAWREGRTGVPIVDAGMHQLGSEGFMHNRARLIVASYLTKTLGQDWRIGARHFEELLIDADVANNSGNWQWVAGTGNDTRPNRVLNPERQARRFDPDGAYVRRHLGS